MKKIISLILLSVILVTNTLSIRAGSLSDGDSNARRRALIDLALNGEASDNIFDNMTDDEFRVFGVFMSNYSTVMQSYLGGDGSATEILKDNAHKLFNASQIGSKQEQVDALVNAYVSALLTASAPMGVTLQEYFEGVTFRETDELGENARLAIQVMSMPESRKMLDDSVRGLIMARYEDYKDTLDSTWLRKELYLSPFGDIMLKDPNQGLETMVLFVPACVNPYVFHNKINFINSYFFAYDVVKPMKHVFYTASNTPFYMPWNHTIGTVHQYIDTGDMKKPRLNVFYFSDNLKTKDELTSWLGSSTDTDGYKLYIMRAGQGLTDYVTNWQAFFKDYPKVVDFIKEAAVWYYREDYVVSSWWLNVEADGNWTNVSLFDTRVGDAQKTIAFINSNWDYGKNQFKFEFNETGFTSGETAGTLMAMRWIKGVSVPVFGQVTTKTGDVTRSESEFAYEAAVKQYVLNNRVTMNLSATGMSGAYAPQMYQTYAMAMGPTLEALPDYDKELVWKWGQDLAGILDNSEEALERQRQQKITELIDRIYMFTSPEVTGDNYRRTWLSAIIADFFLDTHNKIVQVDDFGNNLNVGNTQGFRYAGFAGFVTTPRLSDVPWTAWIVEHYSVIYTVVLIILVLIALLLWLIGKKSFMETVKTVIIVAIVLLFPIKFMDLAIDLSNMATNKLYGGRFNFWAITHMEQANKDMLSLTDLDPLSPSRLIADVSQMNQEYYAMDGGISLKWMMPKMLSVYDTGLLQGNTSYAKNDDLSVNLGLFKWLFSGFYNSEYFTDNPMDLYLYRGMLDIVKVADAFYVEYSSETRGVVTSNGYLGQGDDLVVDWDVVWPYDWIMSDLRAGSDVNTYGFYGVVSSINNSPLVSGNDDVGAIDTSKVKGFHGIAHLLSSQIDDELAGVTSWTRPIAVESKLNLISGTTSVPEQGYFLYSESPFYYFYYALRDIGAGGSYFSNDNVGEGNLKNLLVNEAFYYDDTGRLRDFIDIEGLFTQVIPVLRAGVERSVESLQIQSLDLDEYGFKRDGTKGDTSSSWALYSAWVDTLYDTKLATQDSAIFWLTKKEIGDGINWRNYSRVLGRNMIFCESQMMKEGYTKRDLTQTEMKIQNVLEKSKTDLQYLLNYVNFTNETLTTTAAMIITFNFNQEFSEYNLFTESHIMYPQAYELKNFSYDAFLRLILLNTTGQTALNQKGFYARILTDTSWFTGLCLVINDFVAVYIVAGLKMFIEVLILFMCFLLFAYALFITSEIIKTLMDVAIIPVCQFLGCTIAHAFVISLFMGEGITGVVGAKHISIVTNSPTVTIVLIMIINIVYMVVLFKIFLHLVALARQYSRAIVVALKNSAAQLRASIGNMTLDSNGKMTAGKVAVTAAAAGLAAGAVNKKSAAYKRDTRLYKQQKSLLKQETKNVKDEAKLNDKYASSQLQTALDTGGRKLSKTEVVSRGVTSATKSVVGATDSAANAIRGVVDKKGTSSTKPAANAQRTGLPRTDTVSKPEVGKVNANLTGSTTTGKLTGHRSTTTKSDLRKTVGTVGTAAKVEPNSVNEQMLKSLDIKSSVASTRVDVNKLQRDVRKMPNTVRKDINKRMKLTIKANKSNTDALGRKVDSISKTDKDVK